jgi:hypothetical protein
MLRCTSSAAQHPLSRVCSDDIAGNVINPYVARLPDVPVSRLQSVQHTAVRVVFNFRRAAHVTDPLICLHWLQVPECIRFKVAVLVYRSLQGTSSQYRRTFIQTEVGNHDTLDPTCARPRISNWSLLVAVSPV